jgi:hypothetical protein
VAVNRPELAASPTMMALPCLLLSLGLVLLPSAPHRPAPLRRVARAGAVVAKLDYKDPSVAAEFATVQAFSTEELEKELADSGIIAPPTMNEVDLRLMLVELRMRKAGTLPGKASNKKKPVRLRPGCSGCSPRHTTCTQRPLWRERTGGGDSGH